MVLPRKSGQKDFQVDVSRNFGGAAGMGGLFGAIGRHRAFHISRLFF